jgi:O-antigen/teichoic acid export membrane protein
MALVLLRGSLMSVTWQAIWFFRLVGTSFVIEMALIIIGTNIPFLIYGVLVMSYRRIDTILLSLMTNSAVVGWYGAAECKL